MHHSAHVFSSCRAEELGRTAGYHVGDGAMFSPPPPPPELPHRSSPNPSSKSSSNLTAGNIPLLSSAVSWLSCDV
ncbi:hypothetical protein GUJ93_ZPchr0012g21124 [Zizania palustris]|uniref:Uncharacterized protein n=1 Tax=Zizania palustris TaxID=103762 RepID=A0A8J6BRZ4_ZIZPA|nr:hypothetical protein GUJ93_ZPchr0012g21124 [Zizania palustris]